jgi:hypothetical protein
MNKNQNKTKFIIALAVTFTLAILSLHAASQMIFGVLGRTPEDPGWSYTVALFLSLLVSAIALAIGTLAAKNSLISKLAIAISFASSVAWFCSYYVGIIASDRNPPVAIVSAVTIGLLLIITSFYLRKRFAVIAVTVMGTVAVYGVAFFCSSATFAFLSTNNLLWGGIWGSFCLVAIAMTIFFLNLLLQDITRLDRD